jgi:hypothetical protein
MLEPMPCAMLRPCGFQASAKVSLLNQNQPISENCPTGMMTPQTVIEPILPVTLGPPKLATVVSHKERDHADAGRDRRRRHPREERREIPDRRYPDRDVADGERQEIEQEHLEIAGLP